MGEVRYWMEGWTVLTTGMERSARTYDLHVEVVNTLLVLLSPVAFPRDHTKDASDVSAHNPFLHLLMASAAAGSKKAHWAPGIVKRLLQNFIDQMQSPPASKDTRAVLVALQNAEDTSLIKISEAVDSAEEAEHFSYLTLEGIGSIACAYRTESVVERRWWCWPD